MQQSIGDLDGPTMLASRHARHVDFYARVFALVVAAVLGYALIRVFTPLFGAMTWAAFLAFLLLPLNIRWRRYLRGKEIAAGVLTILAPIVILLPLSALSIEFFMQVSGCCRCCRGRRRSGHQEHLGPAAISRDRAGQCVLELHTGLSAVQVQGWLVAATQHVLQSAPASANHFFSAPGLSAGLRNHVVFVVFFPAGRRHDAGPRALLIPWMTCARTGCSSG